MDYLGRKHQKPRKLTAHKGSTQEFIDRVTTAAGEFGANQKTGAAWKYKDEAFAIATDSRMLYRAYKSLKGETAGEDGIPLPDLWRYGVYVKWCNACKLPFNARPLYRETVFLIASPLQLKQLSMFCEPEHWYRTNAVTFHTNNRVAMEALMQADSFDFIGYTKDDIKEFTASWAMDDNPMTHEIRRTTAPLSFAGSASALLYRAGLDKTQLPSVRKAITRAVAQAMCQDATMRDKPLWHGAMKWLRDPLELGKEAATINEETIKSLIWETCRWISDILVEKGYRPRGLRRLDIPKHDGGVRTLSIPTVIDRVVERAIMLTIEPMLEKRFYSSSVGCRFDKDRFDALSALAQHYPTAKGKFILCADIKKAFDGVRKSDLIASLEKAIPNPDLMKLIRVIIRRPGTGAGEVGIPQGGPLSPTFLNVLLHDRLDAPLLREVPENLTYIRYVDDLAIFGFSSEDEGKHWLAVIQRILSPLGLEVHTQAPKTQIVNLSTHSIRGVAESEPLVDSFADSEVDRYLGLGLRDDSENGLEFFLPASWRERLAEMYQTAERNIRKDGYAGTPGANTHILNATASWIRAFAPAWPDARQNGVIDEMLAIARQAAIHHGDITPSVLEYCWRHGFKWWEKRMCMTEGQALRGWRAERVEGPEGKHFPDKVWLG